MIYIASPFTGDTVHGPEQYFYYNMVAIAYSIIRLLSTEVLN